MAIKAFDFGNDGAQKAERWKQDQIDAVERAKEQQRRREQQTNQQRDPNSHNRHTENPQ
jgi:hypothetical protein